MITLEQVKEDIASGRSKRIYYSAATLWWTHLDSDLAEATQQGISSMERSNERMMRNSNLPQTEKDRLARLFETLKRMREKSGGVTPLDPSGSVLYQMDEPKKWVSEAEKKPDHFGRHGLQTFMIAHHQNCQGNCANTWEPYNLLIDATGIA